MVRVHTLAARRAARVGQRRRASCAGIGRGLEPRLAQAARARREWRQPGAEWQRLALARIVLRPPRLAILDEASANLEAAFESKFFEWCASQPGLTVLTISHNAAVAKHHTHELRLSGAGKSTLKSL